MSLYNWCSSCGLYYDTFATHICKVKIDKLIARLTLKGLKMNKVEVVNVKVCMVEPWVSEATYLINDKLLITTEIALPQELTTKSNEIIEKYLIEHFNINDFIEIKPLY